MDATHAKKLFHICVAYTKYMYIVQVSSAMKTTQAHKVPCKSLNFKQKLELCALQTVKPLKLLQILKIRSEISVTR